MICGRLQRVWKLLKSRKRKRKSVDRIFSLCYTVSIEKIIFPVTNAIEEEIIMSIRIGILGYGNLGKGVESAIAQNPDMELTAVFTLSLIHI